MGVIDGAGALFRFGRLGRELAALKGVSDRLKGAAPFLLFEASSL